MLYEVITNFLRGRTYTNEKALNESVREWLKRTGNRITSYNVCYTKLLRQKIRTQRVKKRGTTVRSYTLCM